MKNTVDIIGGGLAGSECALQLADRGIRVRLFEMRPIRTTDVHHTDNLGELVCSNSLKSTKPDSAAGMLKTELERLGSRLMAFARENEVPAGGALAVEREGFGRSITEAIASNSLIELVRAEVVGFDQSGRPLGYLDEAACKAAGNPALLVEEAADAVVLASGPLTSDGLARYLGGLTGQAHLAFYDAAAPIVMADSLDLDVVFRQSRYEAGTEGDYLNAPFDKASYQAFIDALLSAERVIKKEFETADLFQACQPIEEIARRGADAPRFGCMKPVGLVDPATGMKPWANVQLRAEDHSGQSYNLVGFQTNLTFPEQRRVFRMIPGLEKAEFARYGVMHRNTFIDAPHLLDASLKLVTPAAEKLPVDIYVAGQLGGTEGYCEAIRSGLHVALALAAKLKGVTLPVLSADTVFGALLSYATNPQTVDYQPMHVNFGIIAAPEEHIRNKRERYAYYAWRGNKALDEYLEALRESDLA
ncbi:MAG: methylenetetrahydrofolate--tRNA-(uracil(54)-C(5))-methyltransferase (FADH(2)-oxidizing) TrmFO [Coriobacteriia bacterium]|nr:methylenetetrahydrofolate--tRNA-(uracil(54)-C(5))-methyltransferase (FADH(2)-oxidizing) TrmFO [Coriobacteriia bacterium]